MANMTILDAAEHLGVSKEAIHNRVRRGSLTVSIIDGVKYVDVDAKASSATKPRTQTRRSASSSRAGEDKYYKFLEDQNTQLQVKVEKLEGETRTLRDQKEEMLIQERIKIEQVYKDRDAQLKSILSTLSSQFMLNAPAQLKEEHFEAEIEEAQEQVTKPEKVKGELISLKKYLKKNKYPEKKQEKIKAKFRKKEKKDDRIIVLGNKIYLDTVKFDYSDLLK